MSDSGIVDRILADMDEIDDWGPIADALGANAINSHYATPGEVFEVLAAVWNDPRVYVGVIARQESATPSAPLPDSEIPVAMTARIFNPAAQVDPVGEMVQIFIDKIERRAG